MIVITSYDEFYENAIRKLTNERLARRIATVVFAKHRSNDWKYFENAKINLLLLHGNPKIRKKYIEFMEILKAISLLPQEGYALIKVHPFITHLGNDVDILVEKKNLEAVVKHLSRELQVESIIGKSGKGVTLLLNDMELQVDIYNEVGWRGLKVLDVSLASPTTRRVVRLVNSLEISVIREDIDLAILIAHIFESEGWVTLGDLLKLFILNPMNMSASVENVKTYLNIGRFYSYLVAMLNNEDVISNIFQYGKARIPIKYLLLTSVSTILANLRARRVDMKGYYWEVERLFLEVLRYGLTA
ncbi:hypothetical protein WLZ34_03940 [Thermogladius sp. KZ2Tp1]|uniref:hypothetical protein n=1 Tax=Thermogladius sp. KZ2Tp1 TaxID=3136289 RepID=UPI003DA97DA7